MMVLRFMLEVFLAVVLFPLIAVFELIWLIVCIRSACLIGAPIKEGLKVWAQYIKAGLEMNKDFVVNGL